jgi:hypothetical protein
MVIDQKVTDPTRCEEITFGNEAAQTLISSHHALALPPIVNDMAASMPWILQSAPILLQSCYLLMAVNLQFLCNCIGDFHIHPFEVHLKNLILCMMTSFHPW